MSSEPGTADGGHGSPQVAFVCGQCHREYGDPLYTGPVGHAPPGICLCCWLAAWEIAHGAWPPAVEALYYVACGSTLTDAADRAGISRRTLYRWRCKWREHPEAMPAAIWDIIDVDRIMAVRARPQENLILVSQTGQVTGV